MSDQDKHVNVTRGPDGEIVIGVKQTALDAIELAQQGFTAEEAKVIAALKRKESGGDEDHGLENNVYTRLVVDHAVKAGDMLMVDDKMCWRASQEDGGWDGLAIEDKAVGEMVRVQMIRMPAYLYDILRLPAYVLGKDDDYAEQ